MKLCVIMIKLLAVLAIAHNAVANRDPTLARLDEIFDVSGNEDENRLSSEASSPSCIGVVGTGRGCYECYLCNHTLLMDSRIQKRHVQLQLKDSYCASTTVCCVAQRDLVGFRSSELCGRSNTDGKPRKRRSAPRAVLQGEFPWRAWVYKKNSQTPLCAATFIHEDSIAFLTLASCVQGLSAEGLELAFVKGGQRAAISRIIVHASYKTGEDTNNIAILKLRSLESTPDWASPACLPLAASSHGLPCLTTSDKDTKVNTVIPLRTACTEDHKGLPESLTCAVAPSNDYEPERAAGLFCKDQHVTTPAYTVHGLAISRQDESVSNYVNVWHFSEWIADQLKMAH